MAKQNQSTPAQGTEGSAEKSADLFDHVVTQADLDNNPDLAEAGVKVGETIQVPVKDEGAATLLVAQTPDWVQTILDSNISVVESNNQLAEKLDKLKENFQSAGISLADVISSNEDIINALSELKDRSSRAVGNYDQLKAPEYQAPSFDENAEYVVAEGKSFADKHDITKKYSAGEDVTHLGAERLQSLLNQGLIEQA